jgi:protein-arginine kinase activator protein McsA
MTEEELRETLICQVCDITYEYSENCKFSTEEQADRIINIFREAGWKSPEEEYTQCPVCGEEFKKGEQK